MLLLFPWAIWLILQGQIPVAKSLMPSVNPGRQQPMHKYVLTGKAQGTTYRIIYYTSFDSIPARDVDSLLDLMEDCFSLYRKNSLVNQFNRSERGVLLNPDLKNVMEQCFAVYRDTRGLADPTVYPLVRFWSESEEGNSKKQIRKGIRIARRCVGLDGVVILKDSLLKAKPCLQLDLNGSAQGYTVDLLARSLEQHGIKDYLVELGGEIRIRGRKQPTGEKFAVALEQPGDGIGAAAFVYKNYYLGEGAVTTSGNYRKFMESGGKGFGHIIDPYKGYPFQNELISVTLFATTALIADAYDNAVFGMGLERGLKFIEAHPFLKAVFIYRDKSGKIRVRSSSRPEGDENS